MSWVVLAAIGLAFVAYELIAAFVKRGSLAAWITLSEYVWRFEGHRLSRRAVVLALMAWLTLHLVVGTPLIPGVA